MRRNHFLLNRRQFIAGSTALAAAGAVSIPKLSYASGGQIVVGNWGGGWHDRTVKFFEDTIIKDAGYTIMHDLAAVDKRRTKLLAERRLPTGTLDIAHLFDSDVDIMNELGVLESIDESMVPRLANVHPNLLVPNFVPWQFSGYLIGYNPETVAEPPASFADLWNPKYAGLVGLNDVNWHYIMEMAGLVNGGSMTDIPAMKSALMDLKKAVAPKIYPQHLQQAQALQNGEVSIATNYKGRMLEFADQGVSLEYVFPEEGAITVVFGVAIPKNARNVEAALFYANALLDAEGMNGIAQESFYAPAVRDANLPAELSARIEFTPEEQDRLHQRNATFWTENQADLYDWWNEEFKA